MFTCTLNPQRDAGLSSLPEHKTVHNRRYVWLLLHNIIKFHCHAYSTNVINSALTSPRLQQQLCYRHAASSSGLFWRETTAGSSGKWHHSMLPSAQLYFPKIHLQSQDWNAHTLRLWTHIVWFIHVHIVLYITSLFCSTPVRCWNVIKSSCIQLNINKIKIILNCKYKCLYKCLLSTIQPTYF